MLKLIILKWLDEEDEDGSYIGLKDNLNQVTIDGAVNLIRLVSKTYLYGVGMGIIIGVLLGFIFLI